MIRIKQLTACLLTGALFAASGAVAAMDDSALAAVLDRRLEGDASGACMAAAVIDGAGVARAFRCADPADAGRIGPDAAFEIGSVTKTMTAILMAELILRGEASLDDPLADHLPEGTAVPEHAGQPIRLRHIVTHTSGLPRMPPRFAMTNPGDPYADFDSAALLGSLGDVTLAQAPGEAFEYSNFGSMLLSLVVARQAGVDFERLLDQRLFSPLGMEGAYVSSPPEGVRPAAGHLPNGTRTPPWTFADELAGVGGVRATLEDMVRYARAQLGGVDGALGEAIALAQRPIETGASQPMAMNWVLLPIGERLVHAHDGGTGGFSSMMAFDTRDGRAVVVMADTGLSATGGVSDVVGHLMDDSIPLSAPRRPVERPAVAPAPPAEALRDYAGTYPLMPGFALTVRERGGVLHAQATGQSEFALDPVAEDVFAAPDYDIEIEFHRDDAGEVVKLDLRQAGNVINGERQPATGPEGE